MNSLRTFFNYSVLSLMSRHCLCQRIFRLLQTFSTLQKASLNGRCAAITFLGVLQNTPPLARVGLELCKSNLPPTFRIAGSTCAVAVSLLATTFRFRLSSNVLPIRTAFGFRAVVGVSFHLCGLRIQTAF